MKNLSEKVLIGILIIILMFLCKNIENCKKIHNKAISMAASDFYRSMERLLLLAKQPLGKTMYIWGGGWNEEDTGAGTEAVTLGVSPKWEKFALKQDKNYDFNATRYQIHDGLDCSGYMGWLVYNLMETEDGKPGYVVSSSKMAKFLAEKGFGEYTESSKVEDWQLGDIMSMEGHVWMALGSCEDGSVVVLHASPPGVTLSGTVLSNGDESKAVKLAKTYMKKYYPKWYEKYGVKACGYEYLTDSDQMRWSEELLKDRYQLRRKKAEDILEWMFGKIQVEY